MPNFVIPFVNLLFSFIALVICTRYLFSRKGWLWILPLLLSLVFSLLSAIILISKVSSSTLQIENITPTYSYILLLVLILWFFVLISFRYAVRNFGSKLYSASISRNEAAYLNAKNCREPNYKEY
ncbi:MAG: hypothetical protein PHD05_02100 [Sphaerochaetaceae bacterium]|nr:hypothetical protein [Sphaerochaetaceae bacterium]